MAALFAIAIGLFALAGCGGGQKHTPTAARTTRSELQAYLVEIEPIRLSVNRLLDRADPILSAYRDHRISPKQAASEMGSLERRFAAYTVDVAAIVPPASELRTLHSEYAQTYIFEDAYLSALTTGLAQRELGRLPDTVAMQRAAIIRWRTGLTVIARYDGLALPADLQQAGRGEIAPTPGGS